MCVHFSVVQFKEIPGNLKNSQLCVWPTSPSKFPTSFAWLTGAGIYHGMLGFGDHQPGESLTLEKNLIPYATLPLNLLPFTLLISLYSFYFLSIPSLTLFLSLFALPPFVYFSFVYFSSFLLACYTTTLPVNSLLLMSLLSFSLCLSLPLFLLPPLYLPFSSSLQLCYCCCLHSYSVAMDTGEEEEKDYSQKDVATPIGLALTEFHCVLLFRDKYVCVCAQYMYMYLYD